MQIELYDYDYSQHNSLEQSKKVSEELQEFIDAETEQEVIEEAFDVIQAMIGFLITLGLNIEEANRLHIEKLQRRHQKKGGQSDGKDTTGNPCPQDGR